MMQRLVLRESVTVEAEPVPWSSKELDRRHPIPTASTAIPIPVSESNNECINHNTRNSLSQHSY